MNSAHLRVDPARLLARLTDFAAIGTIDGGGVCRLALTDTDRDARDALVACMAELGLVVRIDAIGNIIGTRAGRDRDAAPIMIGSHIDSVRTGGTYDGTYGVLAGLAVVEALTAAGVVTVHPLDVVAFTGEEGSRFQPDALGSLAYTGGAALETLLDVRDRDGARLGDELERIGYAGPHPCPGPTPHAYVELHIEQGPVLERLGRTIGAVTGVQGICWQEVTIRGQSNHAGTTPMDLRRDAGLAAARVTVAVHEIVTAIGGRQVGTVGSLRVHPDLVNVVAGSATLTIDLRNTDAEALRDARTRVDAAMRAIAKDLDVEITSRVTADSDPVEFAPHVIELVERTAARLGHTTHRLPSGAAHDAQNFPEVCPAAMIFVPSAGGLSHNVAEHTAADDLVAGADVLLQTVLALDTGDTPAP